MKKRPAGVFAAGCKHKIGMPGTENKGLRERKSNKKSVKDSMTDVMREGRKEKETDRE